MLLCKSYQFLFVSGLPLIWMVLKAKSQDDIPGQILNIVGVFKRAVCSKPCRVKLGTAPVVSLLSLPNGECIRMDVLLGQSTAVLSSLLFLYKIYFCTRSISVQGLFLYRILSGHREAVW